MGDDITIGVTEIVNNIEVTAQPNDQIVDISVIDNADDVTLNITPTVIEINVNKGSSYAKWGTILGTLSDQTDLQGALDLKANLVDGKVPASELPSYVDDVVEVADYAALPTTGETGKIYITLDTNKVYRWSGSIYIEIAANSAIWGAITGTLTDQTDLVNTLNLRVPYTGATGNVNLGEYGLTSGYLQLDTTPTSTPTSLGTLYWDTEYRTASLVDGLGNTTLQLGQEERILIHNNTGSTLTDGQVVYITGSTGELPSVSLASASSETTSAATLGVITESIANGSNGFVTVSGIVHGLNTLAYNEGDLLWLGTTAGTFTTTKPTSPNHLVLIGYVVKKSGGNGSILVKIQNTQELEESSDVLFTSLTNNDILTYESSSSLWKNKSISTILGYTPSNDSNVVHKTGAESIAGVKTFTDSIKLETFLANKIISGGYMPDAGYGDIYQNDRQITFIQKNAAATAVTQFSFIYPDSNTNQFYYVPNASGTLALTSQLHNAVTIGTANGLSLSTQVLSLGLASSSANGALSSTDWTTFNNKQNALTNPITGTGTTNYLPKFTGSTSLGNSLIYDNGNIGINTTSPLTTLTVSGNLSLFTTNQIRLYNSAKNNWTEIGSPLLSGDTEVDFRVLTKTGTFYINASGSVGIGTTSPTYKLQVNGTAAAASNAEVLRLYNTLDGGLKINFANAVTNELAYITASVQSSGAGTDDGVLTFGTATNGTASERMRINESGNVGIGTTSPANKLTVTANDVFNQDSSGQIVIRGASNTNKALLLGFDTTSNYGYLQAIEQGTSTRHLSLQPFGGNVGIGTTTPTNGKLVVKDSGYQYIAEPTDAATYGYLGIGHFTNGTFIGTTAGSNSASDILRFGTSGSERMRITSGGNVGIGTTAPAQKLEIKGNISVQRIDSSTDTGIVFANEVGSSRAYLNFSATNERLYYKFGTSELFSILSSGNVGIGTTSPSVKLHVYDNSTVYLDLESVTASSLVRLKGGTYSGFASLSGGVNQWYLSGGGASKTLTIGTDNTERMRITSGGNVGIGTTSPEVKLDVRGSLLVDAFNTGNENGLFFRAGFATSSKYNVSILAYDHESGGSSPDGISINGYDGVSICTGSNTRNERMRVTSGGNVLIGTTYNGRKLNIGGSAYVDMVLKSTSASGVAGGGTLYFGNSTDEIAYVNYDHAYNFMSFATNSVERVRITSSGDVGIGSNSTSSYKLYVAGGQYGTFLRGGDLGTGSRALSVVKADNSDAFYVRGDGPVFVTNLGTGIVYSNGGALTSTNPSDSRLKDNIVSLNYGLNEILKLRPVSYNWKDDKINQGKQFGFIAQEVQEVMPELVKEFETEEGDRLGLDKEGIYAALVNAIKEQQKQIEELKKLINK